LKSLILFLLLRTELGSGVAHGVLALASAVSGARLLLLVLVVRVYVLIQVVLVRPSLLWNSFRSLVLCSIICLLLCLGRGSRIAGFLLRWDFYL